jgi:plasmid stability protein
MEVVDWWMHRPQRIETMGSMTIRIPDDLARGLEGIAAAQHKSVEELAVERLRSLFDRPTSPQALLRTIQALPHPSRPALDDLDAAIAAARLPVCDEGAFDR